jgi:hypothetical protein
MGAGLLAAAATHAHPYLGRHHAARVVLDGMCTSALDKDEKPAYFGGHFRLARKLGLTQAMQPSDLPGDPKAQRKRAKAIRREVSKAVKILVQQGIVSVASEPCEGQSHTVYRLHVYDYPPRALFTMPPRDGAALPLPHTPIDPDDAAIDAALRPPTPPHAATVAPASATDRAVEYDPEAATGSLAERLVKYAVAAGDSLAS